MLHPGLLVKAHQRAQRRLRAMVVANTYGDPQATETRLYVQSERLVDALLIEAAWEQTKAELDALILDDRDQDEEVAAVYDDRAEDYWAAYETEAEMRAEWGDR